MSLLHVLLPALARGGGGEDFAHWIARGDRLADLPNPREALTRNLFRFDGGTLPAAALRHHVHAPDAGSGAWLCADPAYVRSEATGARLMAWPRADIGSEEAAALSASLEPLFGELGLALAVDTPSAWCVRLAGGTPDASFTPPADALGAALLDCLPNGETGRFWRRLFNEVQVALHAHPLNAERAAAGKLPVNAVWFWGAGSLPASVTTRLAKLATGDDILRGLGKLTGIACVEPEPEALDAQGVAGDVLLDLEAHDAGAWARWLPCFRQALRDRRFAALDLLFPGGERFRVRHAHRLRWWRRG